MTPWSFSPAVDRLPPLSTRTDCLKLTIKAPLYITGRLYPNPMRRFVSVFPFREYIPLCRICGVYTNISCRPQAVRLTMDSYPPKVASNAKTHNSRPDFQFQLPFPVWPCGFLTIHTLESSSSNLSFLLELIFISHGDTPSFVCSPKVLCRNDVSHIMRGILKPMSQSFQLLEVIIVPLTQYSTVLTAPLRCFSFFIDTVGALH